MIDNKFIEDVTKIYLISYNTALKEVKNQTLAAQAAFMVTTIICKEIEEHQKSEAGIMGMMQCLAAMQEVIKSDEQSAETAAGEDHKSSQKDRE